MFKLETNTFTRRIKKLKPNCTTDYCIQSEPHHGLCNRSALRKMERNPTHHLFRKNQRHTTIRYSFAQTQKNNPHPNRNPTHVH